MPLRAEYLITFCKVADLRSVSAAADALGLSQPAVSKQLAVLQNYYPDPLYERDAHGVHLTPAGEALKPYACAVSKAMHDAKLFLKKDSGALSLTIGLSHHLVTRLTAAILKKENAYTSPYPITVHLVEGYSAPLRQDVIQHTIDAALILAEPTDIEPSLNASYYGQETLSLLVKTDDPIAKETTISIKTLQGETLILPAASSSVYKRIQTALRSAGLHPERILEVSGPAAVRSAVIAGLGIGVTLPSFIKADEDAGLLKSVPIKEPGFTLTTLKIMHKQTKLESRKFAALEFLLSDL